MKQEEHWEPFGGIHNGQPFRSADGRIWAKEKLDPENIENSPDGGTPATYDGTSWKMFTDQEHKRRYFAPDELVTAVKAVRGDPPIAHKPPQS